LLPLPLPHPASDANTSAPTQIFHTDTHLNMSYLLSSWETLPD